MDPTSSKVVRFSTDEWPEAQRIVAFREIYGRTILKHDIEQIDDEPFHFEAALFGLPGLGMALSTISPCRAPRGLQHIDSDDLVFNISLDGGRIVTQRGREALLHEREAVLTTSADPGVVTITLKSRLISFRIPRAILRPMIADLDDCLVRPIQPDTPALRLLVGYIGAIRNEIVLAKPTLRDLIVAHVHDLISLTLGATREAGEIAKSRGVRAARLRGIKDEIMDNLGDGDLSIDTIALRHGITPRYVHMLFETEGMTFSGFVLDRRLARAHRRLGDLRDFTRTIGAIALECGFNDLSYFNRTFRRRYGATPSDIRAAVRCAAMRRE